MISNITMTSRKYELDERTKKYVTKKIGALDRYLPRHARKSVSADVKLSQIDGKNGNKYEVEVIMKIPEKTVTAKDSTLNMMAAVDIVEAKLATQLRKYKQTKVAHVGRQGLMARFKRSFAREQQ